MLPNRKIKSTLFAVYLFQFWHIKNSLFETAMFFFTDVPACKHEMWYLPLIGYRKSNRHIKTLSRTIAINLTASDMTQPTYPHRQQILIN